MSINLKLSVLIFVLILLLTVIVLLRKGKFSTKYAIIWIFACFILLLLVIFPGILSFLAGILGFEMHSNMIFSIFIGILLFLALSLTIIVSNQKEKINMLIQEVSLLRSINKLFLNLINDYYEIRLKLEINDITNFQNQNEENTMLYMQNN